MSIERKLDALYEYIRDTRAGSIPDCGGDLPATKEKLDQKCGECKHYYECLRLRHETDAFNKLTKVFQQ